MVKKEEKKIERTSKNTGLNRALIENFVSLQKVMTNLAIKFDKLSDNISTLLQLFEISAKSFAEKQGISSTEKDREFLNKINMLLEQNKTIAKGLTLMEEKMRERLYGQQAQAPMQPRFMPPRPEERRLKPLPSFENESI